MLCLLSHLLLWLLLLLPQRHLPRSRSRCLALLTHTSLLQNQRLLPPTYPFLTPSFQLRLLLLLLLL